MADKHHEMIEGPQAFKRFRDAMKVIMSVPKSAIPKTKVKSKRKTK